MEELLNSVQPKDAHANDFNETTPDVVFHAGILLFSLSLAPFLHLYLLALT